MQQCYNVFIVSGEIVYSFVLGGSSGLCYDNTDIVYRRLHYLCNKSKNGNLPYLPYKGVTAT